MTRLALNFFLIIMLSCSDGHESEKNESSPSGQATPNQNDNTVLENCRNTFTLLKALPTLLSETGLYEDVLNKVVHQAQWPYTPEFQFWSDFADKERWIYVPECEKIDTSNMSDWSFPVGTRFYKEFSVEGQRIETRLILRTGKGPYDFLYGTYQWNDEETEATLVPEEGVLQAKGTNHDIPSEASCRRCHGSHEKKGGRPSRALGFSAMQLNHENAQTLLSDLVAQDRLTHAPVASLKIPGNETERAALGYLHVNCGVCHNGTPDGVPQTDMNLWIAHDVTTVETTSTYLSTVAKANKIFNDQHVTARIEPGVPDKSSIIYRMSQRGNNAQMPPLATHEVDQAGLEAVRAWILSLP